MYVEVDGNEAKLYGTIWGGDGPYVTDILNSFFKGKTDVTVRLHTPGGSVIDGNLIFNTLAKTSANVHIIVDGIAASMGSILILAGNKVSIADNAYVMIHAPSGDVRGNAKDLQKVARLLTSMEKNFVSKYAAKTGKSEEEVAAWLDGDNWFSAEEAKAEGLVDEIIPSVLNENFADMAMGEYNLVALADNFKTFDEKRNNPESLIDNEDDKGDTPPNTQTNNLNTMSKLNAASLTLLGLKEDATEAEIQAKLADQQKRLSDAEAKNVELEASIETQRKTQVDALVNGALASGKILAADKEHYTELATANFELASKTIDKLPAKPSLSGMANQKGKSTTVEGREKWTFQDWSKQDTKGLLEMKSNDPEAYKALAEKSGVKL